jgi:hypothetical protein
MSSVIGESSKGKGREDSKPQLTGNLHKEVKIKTPEPFKGERSKIKGFLIHIDLYFTFHASHFKSDIERILYVVSLLEAEALNWIEGFVVDYMKNTNERGATTTAMRQETINMFGSYQAFIKALQATFGPIDEERQAERAIQSLRQRGSASTYTAEFQRWATKTGWNDDALRAQYYRGLKDSVKDELIKEDKSDTLKEMIDDAVKIDNRLYERALEKRGFYDPGHRQKQSTKKSYWPQPMELDTAHRGELTPQEKQKRQQERLCFSCGKPGHMARNCKSRRTQNRHGRRGELNATTRGGYNGPMQFNATLRDTVWKDFQETTQLIDTVRRVESTLADQDEISEIALEGPNQPVDYQQQSTLANQDVEQVTQSLAAVNFVENLGSDPETSEQSDGSEYSADSRLSYGEQMEVAILEGSRTAQDWHECLMDGFDKSIEKAQREIKADSHPLRQGLKTAYRFRWSETQRIIDAAKTQIRQLEEGDRLGIRRSQQYQDVLSANTDYLPKLEREMTFLAEEIARIGREIEEKDNVARADHPKHGQLTWSACYHDSCKYHYQAKMECGYFPSRQIPVYWGNMPTTTCRAWDYQAKN